MALSNLTRAAAKALAQAKNACHGDPRRRRQRDPDGRDRQGHGDSGGPPLLAHSMLAFQQCVQVSGIIVVTAAESVLFCGGDGAAVWRL